LIENILKKPTSYTTREQEHSKAQLEKPYSNRKRYHIALYRLSAEIEGKLRETFIPQVVEFHYFVSLEELFEKHRHSHLDLIIIALGTGISEGIKLLSNIKKHPTLQLIPTILYSPNPKRSIVIRGFEYGAEEFLTEDWDTEIIGAKLRMLLFRSLRDIGVNPTSNLPGVNAIESDVDRRLKDGDDFAICYADLDNFKAYNDYYGYVYGDKVIRLTSTIIRDTVLDLVPDGFIGHIGGDDFIFVVPFAKVDSVCRMIIDTFDKMIIAWYGEDDIKKGFIKVADRGGLIKEFPIMTISIAVIPQRKVKFTHLGEVSHIFADLKKYTKSFPGSNYRIERRAKY